MAEDSSWATRRAKKSRKWWVRWRARRWRASIVLQAGARALAAMRHAADLRAVNLSEGYEVDPGPVFEPNEEVDATLRAQAQAIRLREARASAEEQRLNERIAKIESALASEQESAPFFHTPCPRMLAPIRWPTSTQDYRILTLHANTLIEVPSKFLRREGRCM